MIDCMYSYEELTVNHLLEGRASPSDSFFVARNTTLIVFCGKEQTSIKYCFMDRVNTRSV